jgi:hypothetical protein
MSFMKMKNVIKIIERLFALAEPGVVVVVFPLLNISNRILNPLPNELDENKIVTARSPIATTVAVPLVPSISTLRIALIVSVVLMVSTNVAIEFAIPSRPKNPLKNATFEMKNVLKLKKSLLLKNQS